jgi:Surface antigen
MSVRSMKNPAQAASYSLLAGLLMVMFSACVVSPPGPRATVGGLGGAAAGGLLGAVLGGGAKGIASGALLGGLLGGAIGDKMDQADRQYASQATYQAFEKEPSGFSSTWRNPDSGNYGEVTPTRTYQAANGTYCREYQQTITVAGKTERSYGTACRQPGGGWKIID